MSDVQRIRSFLRAVRRRAGAEAGLRVLGVTAAALLLALLVLAACAAKVGPASFWPGVTVAVVAGCALAGVVAAWILGVWRLRSERALARFVGRRAPAVGSDLLSAVELADPRDGARAAAGTSPSMLTAFYGTVAARVEPLDLRQVVPFRPAVRTALVFGGAAIVFLAALALAPDTLQRGLSLLLRRPTRFEGAAVATQPLIGDVRLTYVYPPYTGLPQRIVDGSTGDVVGVKGTKVVLETQLLRKARKALLLLGNEGEGGERQVELAKGKLTARFDLVESGVYRVWLSPLIGRPLREARAHRIVVEADHPPRVEILGPADRLELPTPRPIEVGFQASDDFGLGAIDLVYRVDDGAEQRIRLRDAAGERSAQGRTVFEPDLTTLAPGGVVAYRIEARDRDAVSGAKAASSRTLYVVIQNPRDNVDEQLVRQKEVLERLLDNLADRLETADAPPAPGAAPADAAVHLATWLSLHEAEEAQVAALGRVIDEERRGGTTNKTIVAALAGVADRLGRSLRAETGLLAALRSRADQGALGVPAFGKLFAHAGKHAHELESAILVLDDLIGRQRLDDLAGMARELTDSFKRLQDLLARYESTKDEALKQQLAREIAAMRTRIAELARKIEAVKARNEVPSEWQNMPDVKEALAKANDFNSLLEKGDPQSLSKALSELGQSLQDLQKMLDKNANDFASDRFPQENKALSELLQKIGDLEGDERQVAGEGQGLSSELEEEHARRMAGEMEKRLAEAKEKIERLRQKLGTPAPRELDEDATDELRRAQESTKQMKRHVGGKELGEAQKEAERAISSLEEIGKALEKRAASRKPTSGAFGPFQEQMEEAKALSEELAQDLKGLSPKGNEMLSPQQRARASGMSERQGALGERAAELAREAQRKAGQAPGLDQAASELQSVGDQMKKSGSRFSEGDMKEGAGKAQEAADRLAKLRDQMRNGSQGSGRQQARDPVRIPGADESKAPREWRQELMEAMRERAPERYNDVVKKYYEELVK